VGNQPNQGRGHFSALVEAKPDLTGFLLVDQDAPELQNRDRLAERKWKRREIENYLCQPRTLESFAREVGRSHAAGPLFEQKEEGAAFDAMRTAIRDHVAPAALRDPNHPWWRTMKASDEFLDAVLPALYQALGRRVELSKGEYFLLVRHIPEELIDPEVREVLDAIAEVARQARPVQEE
jgi:hypothetical protein